MPGKHKTAQINLRAPDTAAHILTFQRYPLFQIQDEDPDCFARLEITLRPDSVRISAYPDRETRILSVNVSLADFGAFVENGCSHSFEVASENSQNGPPGPPSFLESELLKIVNPLDDLNYVEICLRPNGASFTVTVSDPEGCYEQMVRISSVDFKAFIDGVRNMLVRLSPTA